MHRPRVAGIAALSLCVGIAALSVCAACNAILGITGDTEIVGAANPEGADSGIDASGIDASQSDAATSYCLGIVPTPTFCADFDEGSCVSGWDETHVTGGTFALDMDSPSSFPAACAASSPAPPPGGLDVVLLKAFDAQIGAASFAFDMKIEDSDPAETGPLLAGLLVHGVDAGASLRSASYALWFVFPTPETVQISEQYLSAGVTKFNGFDVPASITPGKWTRFELDLLSTGGGITSFIVKVDGATVFTHPTQAGADTTGKPSIELGLFSIGQSTHPWRVLYDNVVFDMP